MYTSGVYTSEIELYNFRGTELHIAPGDDFVFLVNMVGGGHVLDRPAHVAAGPLGLSLASSRPFVVHNLHHLVHCVVVVHLDGRVVLDVFEVWFPHY